MTQVFLEDGTLVPVTVIDAGHCSVVQKKSAETDGYTAVQLGAFPGKEKRLGKPRAGHGKKHGGKLVRRIVEFRVPSLEGFESGQEIKVEEVFQVGDRVDVRGVSKGRGFAGTIKRHKFHRGPMTHGSMNHRAPKSIGQCATPGRVFRGKRLPGHMGDRNVTVRNLVVVRIDPENHILLVRGAVPGAFNAEVLVRKTKKGVRVPKYKA
jgi:large subunit ribosomal protein L3